MKISCNILKSLNKYLIYSIPKYLTSNKFSIKNHFLIKESNSHLKTLSYKA